MRITFKEITDGTRGMGDERENEWLLHEVLSSVPHEVIDAARDRQELHVQLLIDNQVVEPTVLNDLLSNLGKHVDRVAENLVADRIEELEQRFGQILEPLENATKLATDQIRQEFTETRADMTDLDLLKDTYRRLGIDYHELAEDGHTYIAMRGAHDEPGHIFVMGHGLINLERAEQLVNYFEFDEHGELASYS